jgi:hypothetical protein
MSTYHVIDDFGCEVFKHPDPARRQASRRVREESGLNGSANFVIEKRERVYTTQTLEEAIKGTPFDPAFQHAAA